ncbi:MAG: hypothetical protein ABS938_04630 [Psychrobacillus psychrodurans]
MDFKDLVHMDSVINACKNDKGNMIGIPVFETMRFIEGEYYGKLIGYNDIFGQPISEDIVKKIEQRMILH